MRECQHGHRTARRSPTSPMSRTRCRSSRVSGPRRCPRRSRRLPTTAAIRSGRRTANVCISSRWLVSVRASGRSAPPAAPRRSSSRTSPVPPFRPTAKRSRSFATSTRTDIVGAATLWFWTASVGEQKYQGFEGRRFNEAALAFSPDGKMLGLSAVPRTINVPPDARGWQLWVLPLPDGQPYRRLQWMTDIVPRVTNLAWMPDSRHMVLGLTSMGTSESHLWMADLQRDRAWSLTRGPGSESYPSSSPDGSAGRVFGGRI